MSEKYIRWRERSHRINDTFVIEGLASLAIEEQYHCKYIRFYWESDFESVITLTEVAFYETRKLKFSFSNGITIEGTFQIIQSQTINHIVRYGLFANLYFFDEFDENYIWHTEGFLTFFDADEEIIIEEEVVNIPVEEEVILIDEEIIEEQTTFEIASDCSHDLFPYIYVRDWAEITIDESKWHFYSPEIPTSSMIQKPLSDQLVTLKKSKDRSGMIKAAFDFISADEPAVKNGKGPFYVHSLDQLTGFLSKFHTLYHELIVLSEFKGFIEFICYHFQLKQDVKPLLDYFKRDDYIQQKQNVLESIFALIIVNSSRENHLKALLEVLTTCNLLEVVCSSLNESKTKTEISSKNIAALVHATLILEKEVFPLPTYSGEVPPTPQEPFYMGELHMVKHKLLRYETGDIASIVSVMPGEKRKIRNRKLDRTELNQKNKTVSSEVQTEWNTQQNDHLNEDLWKAIAETTEVTTYPGDGLVSSYGPPTNITLKGSWNKVYTTQTPEKTNSSNYAKSVLNKVSKRISERVERLRAYNELTELENTSESYIDNSKNNKAVFGIHNWLNKIFSAQVVNYGHRMLFCFVLKDPANAYIEQTQVLKGINVQKPVAPDSAPYNIAKYQDIDPASTAYLEVCQYYGIKDFPLAPEPQIVVSEIVPLSESKLIELPEGYKVNSAQVDFAMGTGFSNTGINIFVGNVSQTITETTTSPIPIIPPPAPPNPGDPVLPDVVQHAIPAGSAYNPKTDNTTFPSESLEFQMAVELTCVPLNQTILTWQIDIYQRIQAAYAQQLAAYDLATNPYRKGEEVENPAKYRQIVKHELQKAIVLQLIDYCEKMLGIVPDPKLDQSVYGFSELEVQRFLQQAMEWKELTYTLFDAYDSQELFSVSEHANDVLSAFLQAKEARVYLPVNPVFNHRLLYFMSTGLVLSLKDKLVPCLPSSDAVISNEQIVYMLKEIFEKRKISAEVTVDNWEVTVPTSLQILSTKQHP